MGLPYFASANGDLVTAVSGVIVQCSPGFGEKVAAIDGDNTKLYALLPASNSLGVYTFANNISGSVSKTTTPLTEASVLAAAPSPGGVAVAGWTNSTLPVGATSFAVNPDGLYAIVTTPTTNHITLLSGLEPEWSVASFVTGSGAPQYAIWTPTGQQTLVTDQTNNTIIVLNLVFGQLQFGQSLVITAPGKLAVTPDGSTVAVAQPTQNTLSILNAAVNVWSTSQTISLATTGGIFSNANTSIIVGVTGGVAWLTFTNGVWAVSQTVTGLGFNPTAIYVDSATGIVYAAGGTGTGFLAALTQSGIIASTSWTGNARDVYVEQGQVAVPDDASSLIRIFSVSKTLGSFTQRSTAAAPSGCTCIGSTSPSVWLGGSSAIWQNVYTSPFQLVPQKAGAVSFWNGGSFSTTQNLLVGHQPSAAVWDSYGSLWLTTYQNDLYRFLANGQQVLSTSLAPNSETPEGVSPSLGISSLLWWNNSLWAVSALTEAVLQLYSTISPVAQQTVLSGSAQLTVNTGVKNPAASIRIAATGQFLALGTYAPGGTYSADIVGTAVLSVNPSHTPVANARLLANASVVVGTSSVVHYGAWMDHYPFAGLEYNLSSVDEQEYLADIGTGNPNSIGYDPFSWSNSILSITAETTGFSGVSNPDSLPWNSGCITSCIEYYSSPVAGLFAARFGYFEIRCQTAKGGPTNSPGFWNIFALYPLAQGSPGSFVYPSGEIDVFEILGGTTGTINQTVHHTVSGSYIANTNAYTGIADTSTGFHTVGVDVQSDFITFYADAVKTFQLATPADFVANNIQWYMNILLAVCGPSSWSGAPLNTDSTVSGVFALDYAGVWTNYPAAYPNGGTVPSKSVAVFLDDFDAPQISWAGAVSTITTVSVGVTQQGQGQISGTGSVSANPYITNNKGVAAIPGSGVISVGQILAKYNVRAALPGVGGVAVNASNIGQSVTWNPADTTSNVTLSNNNLTLSAAGNWGDIDGSRATSPQSSGKYYVEWTTTTTTANEGLGISNASWVEGSVWSGGSPYALVVVNTGAVYTNNAQLILSNGAAATGGTYSWTGGGIVGMAVDFGAQLVWWNINGNWNINSSAGQTDNPAAGTGGYSFSFLTGPFYITWGANGLGAAMSQTLNAGQSPFQYQPTGFAPWFSGGAPTVPVLSITGINAAGFTVNWTASTGGLPITYAVNYRITGQTAWVSLVTGLTVLTYAVTGLNAGVEYDVEVVASNNQGATPSAISNVTTVTESPNGTLLTTPTGTIVDSNDNSWAITSGGQISENGTANILTANVIELLYWNHQVYQQASNANELGIIPGWWYWSGTSWVACTDPVTESAQGATVTDTTQQLVNGAGATFILYQTGTSGYEPEINGAVDTSLTNLMLLLYWNHQVYAENATGWYLYGGTVGSWSFVSSGDPRNQVLSITGISLSGTTVGAGLQVGVTVGAIGVALSSGSAFSGTLSLSGTNASSFQISGTNLVTAASLAASTYSINIVATQSGVSNSPYSQSFSIVAQQASQGPGPAATGTLISADFTVTSGSTAQTIDNGGTWNHSGQVIPRTIWGIATGAMCDSNFQLMTYSNFQQAMQKIPMALYRLNGIGEFYTCFSGSASVSNPNFAPMANLINYANQNFPSYAVFVIGLDYNPVIHFSASDYQTACGKFATYMHTNFPRTIIGWEIGNELVGDSATYNQNVSTYSPYFLAAYNGIHPLYPNDILFGPVANDENGSVATQMVQQCGSAIGAYDYHAYGPDAGTWGFTSTGTGARSYTSIQSLRSILGANGPPIANLEYAGNDVPNGSDSWMTQVDGALFVALWVIWGLDVPGGNVQYFALWEMAADTCYGQIAPNNGTYLGQYNGSYLDGVPSTGTLNIVPSAWMISLFGQWLYGNRVRAVLASTSNQITLLAVVGGPSSTALAMVAVNQSTSASYSGTIGLGHWPVEGTGNGTVQMWTITSANNNGSSPTPTTLTVTSGVTQSVTLPAGSVTLFYNAAGTGGGSGGSPGGGGGTPSVGTNAAFFDDFATLSLLNDQNPSAGGKEQPALWYSPGDQGFDQNGVWMVDPFNSATPFTNMYTVSNSILSLRLDNTPPSYLSACGNDAFIGCFLNTSSTFTQEYGYWEIKCSAPAFDGVLCSCYLQDPSGGSQIDIIEIVTNQAGQHFGKFSLWDPTQGPGIVGSFYTDPAQGTGPSVAVDVTQMHTYGVKITSSTVTFYIDRVAQSQWPTPSGYAQNLFMIVEIGNDPGWVGAITPSTSLPTFFSIDYLVVYTLANSPV